MGFFERHLTLWVLACIALGILLGDLAPQAFAALAGLEYARINLPVGVLIWVMIIPMLVKIDLRAIRDVTRHARGIGITLAVNWLVKPFSMALVQVAGELPWSWCIAIGIQGYSSAAASMRCRR